MGPLAWPPTGQLMGTQIPYPERGHCDHATSSSKGQGSHGKGRVVLMVQGGLGGPVGKATLGTRTHSHSTRSGTQVHSCACLLGRSPPCRLHLPQQPLTHSPWVLSFLHISLNSIKYALQVASPGSVIVCTSVSGPILHSLYC